MPAADPFMLPPLDYKIELPARITTDIPTAADVVAAGDFRRLVSTTGVNKGANMEARKAAIVHEHQVARRAALAGDRPADQLDRRLNNLEEDLGERLDQLSGRVDQLSGRIDELQGVTIKVQRENLLYQGWDNLAQVAFPDGTFPWGAKVPGPSNTMVELPELKSIDAVKNLTTPQLYGFCRGYYPDEPPSQDASRCREKILATIGRERDAHLL